MLNNKLKKILSLSIYKFNQKNFYAFLVIFHINFY